MSLTDKLKELINQIPKPGAPTPSPAEIKALLTQLMKLLEELPRDKNPLDALKKAGAWKDKPIVSHPPCPPIYVKAPCAIEYVNVPTALLRSQINAQPSEHDQYGNALITIKPLIG